MQKKKIIAIIVLLVLIAAAAIAYVCLKPQAQQGAKAVTLTVTHGDGSEKTFEMHTDAETLREAVEELGILEGEDGPYGIYVLGVDGETADEGLEQWWCFNKDGEMLMTGLDDTMIADGEHYEAVFTTGYDLF